jgi:hypothetical protein
MNSHLQIASMNAASLTSKPLDTSLRWYDELKPAYRKRHSTLDVESSVFASCYSARDMSLSLATIGGRLGLFFRRH